MAVSANLTREVSLTSSAGICVSTSIPSLSYVGDHVIKIRGRTFNAIVHASNCKLRDPISLHYQMYCTKLSINPSLLYRCTI